MRKNVLVCIENDRSSKANMTEYWGYMRCRNRFILFDDVDAYQRRKGKWVTEESGGCLCFMLKKV